MLVLLRLALGWHFWSEGTSKLRNPDFSSTAFLHGAKGPLKGFYDSQIPDREGHIRLAPDRDDHPAPIISQWNADLYAAFGHYGFNEQQQQRGLELFNRARYALRSFLADKYDDIVDYERELERLRVARESPTAREVPFQIKRIEEKETELRGKLSGWNKELHDIGRQLQDDLFSLTTADQAARGKHLFSPPAVSTVDRVLPWVLTIVGFLLLIGLFTPVAAPIAALFLLTVIGTQPPWVAGADPVYYQVVEFLSLVLVAVTGAGRFGGLDYFLELAWNRSCPPAEETNV